MFSLLTGAFEGTNRATDGLRTGVDGALPPRCLGRTVRESTWPTPWESQRRARISRPFLHTPETPNRAEGVVRVIGAKAPSQRRRSPIYSGSEGLAS
jgi:hypothetical protein